MVSKKVILKNTIINYYTNSTSDNAINLIYLHGWGSDSVLWFKTFNQEFENRFNIFCIDLPGFAKSDQPKSDLTVSDYASYISDFIEKFKLENVVIVGHSLGGRIGIKLSVKYNSNIKKLILVDSAGIYHTKKLTNLISKVSHLFHPIFKLKPLAGIRRRFYKLIKAEDYLLNPNLQKTFVNIVHEDLTECIKMIKIPTLIIWGENDENEYTPLSDAHLINKYINGSELKIIKDGGHFSFLDNSKLFREYITKFIS